MADKRGRTFKPDAKIESLVISLALWAITVLHSSSRDPTPDRAWTTNAQWSCRAIVLLPRTAERRPI